MKSLDGCLVRYLLVSLECLKVAEDMCAMGHTVDPLHLPLHCYLIHDQLPNLRQIDYLPDARFVRIAAIELKSEQPNLSDVRYEPKADFTNFQ